jgi:hypothetical protein
MYKPTWFSIFEISAEIINDVGVLTRDKAAT